MRTLDPVKKVVHPRPSAIADIMSSAWAIDILPVDISVTYPRPSTHLAGGCADRLLLLWPRSFSKTRAFVLCGPLFFVDVPMSLCLDDVVLIRLGLAAMWSDVNRTPS